MVFYFNPMGETNNNFNEKNLKIAYFLESKKRYLKKTFIFFLILFNLIAYPFLIYKYSVYFSKSKEMDRILEELNQRNIEFDVVNKINTPLDLNIALTEAVALRDGKYNLICQIDNLNRKWFVESLKYKFISSTGFASKEFESFILPEEEKTLVDFNEKIGSFIDQVSCQITQVKWRRTKISDYKFLTIPQDLTFQDIQYFSGANNATGAITQFTFVNSTVYNLRDINLFVFLYEGNKVVGVEKTYVDEIKSGDKKEIKVIWPESIPFVSRTVIKPEINFLVSSTFVELPITPGEKR